MLIEIIVDGGQVVDVKTSEPALVRIVNGDDSSQLEQFETVAQVLNFEPSEEGED